MKKVLGVLVLLLSLVLLGIGGYSYWLVGKTSQPAILSLDEYVKQRPAARWICLTSCKLNLLEASYTQSADGAINDLYVPVYSSNDPNPNHIEVLLHVKDPGTVQLLDAMHGLKTEADMLNYLSVYRQRIFPNRDVQGMVRLAGEFPMSQREILKKVDAALDSNFIVLEENEMPASGQVWVFLIPGAVLLLVAGLLLFRRKKSLPISRS